jgi:spermidine/putrescine-binding protein
MVFRRSLIGVVAVVGALVVSVTAATGKVTAHSTKSADQLVIAGYGGLEPTLFQKYVFDQFTKETGINVTWVTVPGQQVAGITAQNQAHNIQWDMTLKLADSDMATLWKEGYLASMPSSLLASVRKVIPGTTAFAIPSQHGAVMVACNYKLVKPCPKTPKQFFDTKGYPGSRMLPSFQPLVAIGLALEAAGVKPNDAFPSNAKKSMANVKLAEKLLNQVKPSIKTFYSNSSQALQLLSTGEVTIAGLWNFAAARASVAPTSNMTLGASWVGAVNYPQYDVVFKGAPNETNAWKLVKWMIDHPKNLAGYAEADNAGVLDPRAFKLLSAKVRQWLPSAQHKQQSLDSDILWYVKYPSVKQEIDDFWKTYTSG